MADWKDIRLNLLDTEGEEYKYGKKEIKKDLKSQEFPFYTKPKKKKKSDIENYSDFEKLLIEVSEKVSAPKKKPTKYTKEGLFDAMSVVGMIPGTQAYTLDKLTKQQEDVNIQTPQGDVDMQETVEEDMPSDQLSYEELRSRLPVEITDDIVKLLVSSAAALGDFAQIQTQQDVDNFNAKYGVNLVLPSEA